MQNDSLEGLHAAAEDILSALESKDATALVSALHSFLEICESKEDEGEEDGYADGGEINGKEWGDNGAVDDYSPLSAQYLQSRMRGER